MKNKVTIQDIADALQLSRITVSKVLNNSPNVSADTREIVLQKAREMNYKTVNYTDILQQPQAKSFAFVMHMVPDVFHIGSSIIKLHAYSPCNYGGGYQFHDAASKSK